MLTPSPCIKTSRSDWSLLADGHAITVDLDRASDREDRGWDAWKESVGEREKGGARGAYGAGAFDGVRGYGADGYAGTAAEAGAGTGDGPSRDDFAAAIRFGQP